MATTRDLFGDPLAAAKGRGRRGRHASAEDEFAFQCRARGLPDHARNYRFARGIGRQWRFDFAFPAHMLAVEIEGLVVTMATIGGKRRLISTGRHAHADGFREDCRKYATAAQLGWTLLRFEAGMVKTGEAVSYTMRVLATRGWQPGEPLPETPPAADPEFNDSIDFIGAT